MRPHLQPRILQQFQNLCEWAVLSNSLSLWLIKLTDKRGFQGVPVVKNPLCSAGDVHSIPGWRTEIPHATDQPKAQVPQLESLTQHSQVNNYILFDTAK